LILALLPACSSESNPPDDKGDELLAPPAAGEGVQYRMVTHIEAGSEVEHCQFVRAPAEGLNVNHDEVRFTSGSHHVLLYLTPYTSIPTENDHGEPVDTSGVFDCSEGATNGWSVSNLVGGSQNASGDALVDFPPDVAMRVPPNAVLLVNAHYINASSEPLEPEVRVNLYTIPDEDVKHEGGILFWYNAFIRVDANGTGTARMSCAIPDDVTLVNAQSHMHRRGVDYAATLLDPAGGSETLYANSKWEGVPVKQWDSGFGVKAGSRIEYFCDYKNPEARMVWQGPRSTDEMCMFIASYYPARPEISNCAMDPEDVQGTQNLGANWVGNGTGTCSDALGCLANIGSDDDFFQALTSCVLDTAPEYSEVTSAGIRCLLTHANPLTDCKPEIDACQAASQ
jgi:hypothetical protein